jgi:hypothetical protein
VKRCACGCGRSLAHLKKPGRYASDACRARAWKARHGSGAPRAVGTAENGSRHYGGLQVSYRKAVDTLAIAFYGEPPDAFSRARVEEMLRPALPARQRERLDAR